MRKRCNLEHFYVLKTFFHVKHFSHVKHFYLPTYPYFSLTVTINIFKFSRSLLNKLTVNRLPPPFKPIRIRINKPRAAEGGTHLTSLARDIFWSQKSQLYIVNSYSWEILFSQNISLALLVIWVVARSLIAPHSNNTAELIALRISVNFCLANSSPYIGARAPKV